MNLFRVTKTGWQAFDGKAWVHPQSVPLAVQRYYERTGFTEIFHQQIFLEPALVYPLIETFDGQSETLARTTPVDTPKPIPQSPPLVRAKEPAPKVERPPAREVHPPSVRPNDHEKPFTKTITGRIMTALRESEQLDLIALSRESYGDSTPNSIQKLRQNLYQLCSTGRLKKTGHSSWKVLKP